MNVSHVVISNYRSLLFVPFLQIAQFYLYRLLLFSTNIEVFHVVLGHLSIEGFDTLSVAL